MKKILMLLSLLLLLVSCRSNVSINSNNQTNNLSVDVQETKSNKTLLELDNDKETHVPDNMQSKDFVWIKGHYNAPSSWEDLKTIQWDIGGSEYLEIVVQGAVENLSLISLTPTESDGTLVASDIIQSIDYANNQTIVVKINQPEGIPSHAIQFEDKLGHIYTYVIEEKSLSGMTENKNEGIFDLSQNETLEPTLIKSFNNSFIKVPMLKVTAKSLESFVPDNWMLFDSVELDFNHDGLTDYIGVLEIKDFDTLRHDVWEYPRVLFAVKGSSSGTFKLDFQDINLIRNSGDGGIFGDPYLPLETTNGNFTISAYGGSAWRWLDVIEFSYTDNQWYVLALENESTYMNFTTSHTSHDYLKKLSIRQYNSDNFEDMLDLTEETLQSEEFDLVIEVSLGEAPTLDTISNSSFLAEYRLSQINVSKIKLTAAITASDLDLDAVKESILNQESIVCLTDKEIVLRYQNKQKEYLILYNKDSEIATVLLESDRIEETYDYIYNEANIYKNKLYFTQNTLTARSDSDILYTDTVSITLKAINFDGTDLKVLNTFENYKDSDDNYGYIAAYFEMLNNEILFKVYKETIDSFYLMDIDGETVKFLGEV